MGDRRFRVTKVITYEHAPYANDCSKHKPDQAGAQHAYGRSGFVGFNRRVWLDFWQGALYRIFIDSVSDFRQNGFQCHEKGFSFREGPGRSAYPAF